MTKVKLLIVCLVACVSSGCKKIDDPLSVDTLNQQAATASQALGMLLDASVQAVLSDQTLAGTTRAASDSLPDLRRLERSARTIDLATLAVNGRRIFPAGSASGTIDITTSGASATSWPTGSTVLYTGSVQVSLHQIMFINGNGDRLAIPEGTFTHTLDAQAVKTTADNWTVTVDTTASVDPPFVATVTHGAASHSLGLGGSRHVGQIVTRVKDATTDTRTEVRTVDGRVPGTGLTKDSALAALNYTAWTISLDGIPLTWSRNARLTTTIDYAKASTSVVISRDTSFITNSLAGLTTFFGPFTAVEGSLLLQAQLDPAWL